MTGSFCDQLKEFQLSTFEVEPLYSTYIAGCVFNAFLSYTAVMLNIITIHAMRKTSSLPKPLKTLLLSLAASDLGVGLLVQPFTVALIVKWLQQNNPSCTSYTIYTIVLALFGFASFSGVMVISIDRFLAIYLHLRYQELVTYNRVVAVVISIWVLSAFISLLTIAIPANIMIMVTTVIGILCMVPTAFVNYKIYSAVRRHRNQIQALQVQQGADNDEIANAASIRKSAIGTFYIYVVSLLCFVPNVCSFIAMTMFEQSSALKGLTVCTLTVVFLNSSLNPLIYCWKMRNIRHTIMDILRNMCIRQSWMEKIIITFYICKVQRDHMRDRSAKLLEEIVSAMCLFWANTMRFLLFHRSLPPLK